MQTYTGKGNHANEPSPAVDMFHVLQFIVLSKGVLTGRTAAITHKKILTRKKKWLLAAGEAFVFEIKQYIRVR
jgi:hypothetical protein